MKTWDYPNFWSSAPMPELLDDVPQPLWETGSALEMPPLYIPSYYVAVSLNRPRTPPPLPLDGQDTIPGFVCHPHMQTSSPALPLVVRGNLTVLEPYVPPVTVAATAWSVARN